FFLVSGCGDGEGTGGPDAGPIGEMDAGDPCAIDPSAPGCGERCTDTSCPAGEVCAWSAATGARCERPSGQARDAEDRCVAVEACEPGTCSGHGLCEDGTGAIECTCDTGFAGERCERCDEAGGYQRNHA